jgi:hypothetical protein
LAKNATREQIRNDARLFADERPGGASSFVDTTEDNRLIDLRTAELYAKLLKARGHEYYADDEAITIVAGTSTYNLPSDHFETLSITLEWSSKDHELVQPYEFLERHNYRALTWSKNSPKGYRLRGSVIEFLPVPTSPVTGRHWYVPAFPGFSADTGAGGTFDGVNGWERWISLAVALDKLTIADKPTTRVERLLAVMDEQIEELAGQREAGQPARIRNVSPEGGRRRRWV